MEFSLIGIFFKVNVLIFIFCLVRFLVDEVIWRIVLIDLNFLDGLIVFSIFNNVFNCVFVDLLVIFLNDLSIVVIDFVWSISVSFIVVIIDFVVL